MIKRDYTHFAFVVLHYIDFGLTLKSVESILQLNKDSSSEQISIVIVDNNSPNKSGKLLQEYFKYDKNISVIYMFENKGFANGNNEGYKHAKKLNPDFIIIANNDVQFIQKDFLYKIKEITKEKDVDLFGPNIITADEKHQNPLRERSLTINELRKTIFFQQVLLVVRKLRKKLAINNKTLIERLSDKKAANSINITPWKKKMCGVVLHGACIIYAKKYIEKEEFAFSPRTFMYGEEDILSLYAKDKGYSMCYMPILEVLHLEGSSSKSAIKEDLAREVFFTINNIKSKKILLSMMKDEIKWP